MSASRAPSRLGAAGRKLWQTITEGYDLREDERQALLAACRTVDELERLQAALKHVPAVVEGSKGQTRPHPLYAEVRAHRLALRQLLAAVGLQDPDAGVDLGAVRSNAGRQLARRRWERRGAA